MTPPLRCLIVEDDENDALLLMRQLSAGGYEVTSEVVDTSEAMRAALERQPWDIVISDFRLPRFSGMDALALLQASGRDVPFILVSGTIGEDIAVTAMKAGANDYLMKDNLARLVPAVQRELRDADERRARRQAEAALREVQWLRAETERIGHLGGWEFDIDTQQQVWTDEVYRIHELDSTFEPNVEKGISFYTPESRPIIERAVQRAVEEGESFDLELEIITARGNRKAVHTIGLADLPNRKIHGFFQDVTARVRSEEDARRLAMMADAAPSSITVHDFDGRWLWANRRTFEMHGYSEDEFMALSLGQVDASPSAALIAERMQELRERGEASFEVVHFRKDGSSFPCQVAVKIISWDGADAILSVVTDVTESKQAEQALRQSEERFREMFDLSITGVLQSTVRGRARAANPALVRMLGYASQEELLNTLTDLPRGLWAHPEERAMVTGQIAADGHVRGHEAEYLKKDGTKIWASINATSAYTSDTGELIFQASIEDITERKQAEAAQAALRELLTQSQKLESVGLLAGGIAHDFNNMLAAILGYTELTKLKLGDEHPAAPHVEAIRTAAERSAKLTRQLLSFAKKQPVDLKVLDLNTVVPDILSMLRPMVGELVQIVWTPDRALWRIAADAPQLDQVLTNLAVNARDASKVGGVRLEVSATNVVLDSAYVASHPGTHAGEFACLRVHDDGVGMDAPTLVRIFEPFFTTKVPGKGTGLGLSTVFGIVQQHGGFTDVESTPGVGTSFYLYFPRAHAPSEENTAAPGRLRRGTETILLAEDEDSVRAVISEMLKKLGYRVISARDGTEAAAVAASYPEPIHLLLSDVIMPRMNGVQLRDTLRETRPDTRVLFMSGYTGDVLAAGGVAGLGVHVLQKPFSVYSLASTVRGVLDA